MSIYSDPVDHAARYWAEQQTEPDPRLQEWDDAFAEFVAAGVEPKQIRRSYEERIEALEGEQVGLRFALGTIWGIAERIEIMLDGGDINYHLYERLAQLKQECEEAGMTCPEEAEEP